MYHNLVDNLLPLDSELGLVSEMDSDLGLDSETVKETELGLVSQLVLVLYLVMVMGSDLVLVLESQYLRPHQSHSLVLDLVKEMD